MKKQATKTEDLVQNLSPQSDLPNIPWACHHSTTGSNIDAYIETCNEWMTVATSSLNDKFDAQAIAEHIVSTINNQEDYLQIMEEMASALEACLENERLGWSAEHDGEIILNRYRTLIKARHG